MQLLYIFVLVDVACFASLFIANTMVICYRLSWQLYSVTHQCPPNNLRLALAYYCEALSDP